MKKDEQSQINKIFKTIPKVYFYKDKILVEIKDWSFFAEVKDAIKYFEKISEIDDVDKNKKASTKEIENRDKIEIVKILKQKVINKELKESDVVCIKTNNNFDYYYLKSKNQTLKDIKMLKSMIEKNEIYL